MKKIMLLLFVAIFLFYPCGNNTRAASLDEIYETKVKGSGPWVAGKAIKGKVIDGPLSIAQWRLGLQGRAFPDTPPGIGNGKTAYIFFKQGEEEYGKNERRFFSVPYEKAKKELEELGYKVVVAPYNKSFIQKAVTDRTLGAVAVFGHGTRKTAESDRNVFRDYAIEALKEKYVEMYGLNEKEAARVERLMMSQVNLGLDIFFNHSCFAGSPGYENFADFALKPLGTYYHNGDDVIAGVELPSEKYDKMKTQRIFNINSILSGKKLEDDKLASGKKDKTSEKTDAQLLAEIGDLMDKIKQDKEEPPLDSGLKTDEDLMGEVEGLLAKTKRDQPERAKKSLSLVPGGNIYKTAQRVEKKTSEPQKKSIYEQLGLNRSTTLHIRVNAFEPLYTGTSFGVKQYTFLTGTLDIYIDKTANKAFLVRNYTVRYQNGAANPINNRSDVIRLGFNTYEKLPGDRIWFNLVNAQTLSEKDGGPFLNVRGTMDLKSGKVLKGAYGFFVVYNFDDRAKKYRGATANIFWEGVILEDQEPSDKKLEQFGQAVAEAHEKMNQAKREYGELIKTEPGTRVQELIHKIASGNLSDDEKQRIDVQIRDLKERRAVIDPDIHDLELWMDDPDEELKKAWKKFKDISRRMEEAAGDVEALESDRRYLQMFRGE